jgi:hypothetical protein
MHEQSIGINHSIKHLCKQASNPRWGHRQAFYTEPDGQAATARDRADVGRAGGGGGVGEADVEEGALVRSGTTAHSGSGMRRWRASRSGMRRQRAPEPGSRTAGGGSTTVSRASAWQF